MLRAKSYYFRANVAALIVRGDQVLAFQRKDYPDSWQCAQGGYDVAEDTETALWREVQEETGLTQHDLRIIAEHPGWLSYAYPDGRQFGDCIGQTQKWFLLEFIGDEENITLDQHEFVGYQWMPFAELQAKVSDFKQSVYTQLEQWLRQIK